VVVYRKGAPVRLSDLGRVVDSSEDIRNLGIVNGNPMVQIEVNRQPNANIVETVARIKALMPQFEAQLPPTVRFKISSDRTVSTNDSIRDAQRNMILSIGLVIFVVFIFLRSGWSTFIPSISVPVSIIATFGAMYLIGYTLDNLSLMALTIATGFVVDDAIVVIENIVRFIEKGESPLQAALKGARQIGFTVISISLSLVAVFIPLLFMGGIIGRLFHEFAVTLSAAILVSGVVSLTLTPMLCGRFLKRDETHSRQSRVSAMSERAFNAMHQFYERTLKWVLDRQAIMLIVTLVVIVATVGLYYYVPKGFFPQQDTGQLMGTTEAAQDISFAAMKEKQEQVVQTVMQDPAVQAVGSFFGGGTGSALNNGRMFISLKPTGWGKDHRREDAGTVIARLRQKLSKIPGAQLFLTASQDIRVGGRSSKAQYQYALSDQNIDELNAWAPKLVNKLHEYPQIKDATSDQQFRGLQETVVIDRDAAGRLDLGLHHR